VPAGAGAFGAGVSPAAGAGVRVAPGGAGLAWTSAGFGAGSHASEDYTTASAMETAQTVAR
jgi:hypothetical protein